MKQSIECDWTSLLEKARRGDRQAPALVCEQLRDYLLLVADCGLFDELRAKVGASDIVQQTMLEAQQDFEQFQGASEGELRAWPYVNPGSNWLVPGQASLLGLSVMKLPYWSQASVTPNPKRFVGQSTSPLATAIC